jgi:Lrp/AsnC family transcriptional regulator, regulator for asnA, asnC and gidA
MWQIKEHYMTGARSALDKIDRAILAVLQEDARLPNRAIAKRVGSSEPTVRRRVDRLIAEQRIKIVAVASPFSVGYNVVAVIGVQLDRAYQARIETALHDMPEVRFVGVTVGSYDMLLEAWFSDTDGLLTFLSDQLSVLVGIQRVETWQVLKLSKNTYDWGAQPFAPPG